MGLGGLPLPGGHSLINLRGRLPQVAGRRGQVPKLLPPGFPAWLRLGLGLGLDLDMIRQVLLRFGLSWLGWLGLACAFYNISVTCFVTLALFAFLGAS